MTYGKTFAMEVERELAFGSISDTFTAIGTSTLHTARQFLVQNLTNKILKFSIDGSNNNVTLSPNATWTNDVAANKIRDDGLVVSRGSVFYVKHNGTAPTEGFVCVSIIYAE